MTTAVRDVVGPGLHADAIRFRVYGEPRAQGSKRAINRGGHVRLIESAGDNLKNWRQQVAIAARENRPAQLLDGPLELRIVFYLQPPKGKHPVFPTKIPDSSKLIRALEDELTGVVVVDDKLFCHHDVWKLWAEAPWATAPGADVVIAPVGVPSHLGMA